MSEPSGITQLSQKGVQRAAMSERVLAGIMACASLGLLLVAFMLTPSAEGHGTHRQLGLQPCVWASALGQPCPTCGMTTSFAYAARADFLGSFRAQPLGFFMALSVAAAFWVCLHVMLTGSTLARAAAGFMGPRVLWLGLAALLAAWVYKIAVWQGS
jgi:hypothetical protein